MKYLAKVFTLIIFIIFMIHPAMAADNVTISTSLKFPKASFIIEFPLDVIVKSKLKGPDLLLRFNRSWQPPDLVPYISQ